MYQSYNLTSSDVTHLTDEDVRAVVELWVERQGVCEQPTVADVAEGLDITAEEVQALLEEVHVQRAKAQLGRNMEARQRLASDIYGRLSLRATALLCRAAKKPKRQPLPRLQSLNPWDVAIYLSYGNRPLVVIGLVMTILVALTIAGMFALHWL